MFHSTSIIVRRDDGSVGRLNMFDHDDKVLMNVIQAEADRWRTFFGTGSKIEIIETSDKKCRALFSVNDTK